MGFQQNEMHENTFKNQPRDKQGRGRMNLWHLENVSMGCPLAERVFDQVFSKLENS